MLRKPLLSICINTYKRDGELWHCLESVHTQTWASKERVEVLVLDDNETKTRMARIKRYKNKNLTLQYVKPAKRLGMVKGIMEAIKKASGKYVWILSDDDLLSPKAIESVLQVIETEKPDVLRANADKFLYSDKKRKIVATNCLNLERDVSVKTKKALFKLLESKFLYTVDWYTYAMSPSIMKRSLFLTNRSLIDRYNGYSIFSFPQTASVYYSPSAVHCYFIAKSLVLFRVDNGSWVTANSFKTAIAYNRCANSFWWNVLQTNRQNISWRLILLVLLRMSIRQLGLLREFVKFCVGSILRK